MEFKVGDFVVYPIHGIGRIAKIEEKYFSGKGTCRLSYQIALLPKHTVWIPVETSAAAGLRLITIKSELEQYRNLLKSQPVLLPKNHLLRHRELLNRLKRGSFQVMCEVVRDLSAWGWRKPLSPTDAATLRKTRENLYREWATAAGISNPEAIKEIDSLLAAGKSVRIQ